MDTLKTRRVGADDNCIQILTTRPPRPSRTLQLRVVVTATGEPAPVAVLDADGVSYLLLVLTEARSRMKP